jgi:hypothetical protein
MPAFHEPLSPSTGTCPGKGLCSNLHSARDCSSPQLLPAAPKTPSKTPSKLKVLWASEVKL